MNLFLFLVLKKSKWLDSKNKNLYQEDNFDPNHNNKDNNFYIVLFLLMRPYRSLDRSEYPE